MKQKIYEVTLNGQTDLLLHADNIEGTSALEKWRKDPRNKDASAKGDDRSPAWTWVHYLYNDRGKVTIDSDNIMACLTEAGRSMDHPTKRGSLKSQVQSIMVNELGWPIEVEGSTIDYEACTGMIGNNDFEEQEAFAMENGFELFAKRARIGAAKHIRVRPRFANWKATGTITVLDLETFDDELLNVLFEVAGHSKGLCDWRPSSAKPGSFGRFYAELKEVK